MNKNFNSIKVRLELSCHLLVLLLSLIFQFHKGAIRTLLVLSLVVCHQHFNSIKVRLELSAEIAAAALSAFQFHKGAIRTKTAGLYNDNILKFQFHKGAIRTW